MSSVIHEAAGHGEYTEGPELPADTLATYSYTLADQPGRAVVTHYVSTKTWQPEDGLNYLATQTLVSSKVIGQF